MKTQIEWIEATKPNLIGIDGVNILICYGKGYVTVGYWSEIDECFFQTADLLTDVPDVKYIAALPDTPFTKYMKPSPAVPDGRENV